MSDFTFKQLQNDLSKLVSHSLALEGFYQILEGQESVSGPTARAMRITLEAVDPSFASANPEQGLTGKDLVTGLRKTMITVKNIIQWLLRTIGKLVEKFGQALQRLGAKRDELNRAVKEASKASGATVPENISANFAGVKSLFVGDEFLGNDIAQLNNLKKAVDYLWIEHPKSVATVLKAAASFGEASANAADISEYKDKLSQAIEYGIKLPSFGDVSINEYASPNAEGPELKASIPLLGNRGIVMRDPSAAKMLINSADPVEGIKDALTLSVGVFKETGANPESVPLPSMDEVRALNDVISQIVSITEKDSAVNGDIKKYAAELETLLEKLGSEEGKHPETRNQVITMIGALVSAAGDPLVACHEYIIRTVNAEINYLTAAAKAYLGEAA
jgi:hypothetical protein